MRRPRQHADMLVDPLASDTAYSVATTEIYQLRAHSGLSAIPSTQIAGVAIAAAAPYIARDLLAAIMRAPWWSRGRLLRAVCAEAAARVDDVEAAIRQEGGR